MPALHDREGGADVDVGGPLRSSHVHGHRPNPRRPKLSRATLDEQGMRLRSPPRPRPKTAPFHNSAARAKVRDRPRPRAGTLPQTGVRSNAIPRHRSELARGLVGPALGETRELPVPRRVRRLRSCAAVLRQPDGDDSDVAKPIVAAQATAVMEAIAGSSIPALAVWVTPMHGQQ
jgi:hypothetical protein